ncbi:hypothetical protein BDA96_04G152800 [Sorghum bicolor]|uniref:Uncharacterized protein n=1 Tax=Sorghum bicolor TaxID=4558 RepID=A0A921R5K4_SORBI|nr:hypothetical protein BDA96_04G152800 [Sorghum bicolor]
MCPSARACPCAHAAASSPSPSHSCCRHTRRMSRHQEKPSLNAAASSPSPSGPHHHPAAPRRPLVHGDRIGGATGAGLLARVRARTKPHTPLSNSSPSALSKTSRAGIFATATTMAAVRPPGTPEGNDDDDGQAVCEGS